MRRITRIVLLLAAATAVPLHAHAAGTTGVVRVDAAPITAFTLQIATYSERESAERVRRALPDAWIEEVRDGGNTLFRVNYRKFKAREEAIKAQWDLEDLGYNSFIQKLYT